MTPALRYPIQAVMYGAFVAVVGYFSSAPPYSQLAPDEAIVKLSLVHGGQPLHPCRPRTPEELAKLAPNMRSPMDCPRERAPVAVALDIDGRPVVRVVAAPAGLARDGPSTIYRRLALKAGMHSITARLGDRPSGELDHVETRSVDLKPGRILVIDYKADEGRFEFNG